MLTRTDSKYWSTERSEYGTGTLNASYVNSNEKEQSRGSKDNHAEIEEVWERESKECDKTKRYKWSHPAYLSLYLYFLFLYMYLYILSIYIYKCESFLNKLSCSSHRHIGQCHTERWELMFRYDRRSKLCKCWQSGPRTGTLIRVCLWLWGGEAVDINGCRYTINKKE